jgi:hypothetical protein
MRTLKTSRRFAGLIAVLVLATSITAASAQPQNRNARTNTLELTYTKWFAPGFPHMVGVIGGDVVGQFGGAVLQATNDGRLKAIYIVVAPNPSRSLTIRLNGASDPSGAAVLNGRVVDGRLTGARAHVEFETLLPGDPARVIAGCAGPLDGPCFQGTISIKQRDDD